MAYYLQKSGHKKIKWIIVWETVSFTFLRYYKWIAISYSSGYMYKNRVKIKEWQIIFWNSHSFILRTRKFSRKQSRKIQNICCFEFSYTRFPCSLDKRAGISKFFVSFFNLYPIFIHTYPGVMNLLWRYHKKLFYYLCNVLWNSK